MILNFFSNLYISPNYDYNYPININNTNENKDDKISKK